jgi:hypothetical protein
MFDGMNLSILAIPAHWCIATGVHFYAVSMAKNKMGRFDNVNPRSPETKKTLLEKLGPETYACFERAKVSWMSLPRPVLGRLLQSRLTPNREWEVRFIVELVADDGSRIGGS